MNCKNYPLRDNGIYRNLPQFDPSLSNLTAVITGANGISGFGLLRALLDSPTRWSKIYTISRKPVPLEMLRLVDQSLLGRIQHVPCDFLSDSTSIAEAMKKFNVTADYIFYYAYLQPAPPPGQKAWSNDKELDEVNGKMLSNFIKALPQANIKPKRFLLQTGAKNYGVHLGLSRVPCCESDPQPRHLGPNFYYGQEDTLFEYCRQNSIEWNVIRPAWIIGATTMAQMNPMLPFAIYAAVSAERGLPLEFPSTVEEWRCCSHRATSFLTGYLCEWAVLEDKCANEAFNSQDAAIISWDRFWSELARWYGVETGFEPAAFQVSSGNTLHSSPE